MIKVDGRLNRALYDLAFRLSRHRWGILLSLLVSDIRYWLLGVRSRWLLNYLHAIRERKEKLKALDREINEAETAVLKHLTAQMPPAVPEKEGS